MENRLMRKVDMGEVNYNIQEDGLRLIRLLQGQINYFAEEMENVKKEVGELREEVKLLKKENEEKDLTIGKLRERIEKLEKTGGSRSAEDEEKQQKLIEDKKKAQGFGVLSYAELTAIERLIDIWARKCSPASQLVALEALEVDIEKWTKMAMKKGSVIQPVRYNSARLGYHTSMQLAIEKNQENDEVVQKLQDIAKTKTEKDKTVSWLETVCPEIFTSQWNNVYVAPYVARMRELYVLVADFFGSLSHLRESNRARLESDIGQALFKEAWRNALRITYIFHDVFTSAVFRRVLLKNLIDFELDDEFSILVPATSAAFHKIKSMEERGVPFESWGALDLLRLESEQEAKKLEDQLRAIEVFDVSVDERGDARITEATPGEKRPRE